MNQDHEFQQRLQAWIDGELDPAEAQAVAATVERDPAARQLATNLKTISALLRAEAPQPKVPESRDFYWSRIRQGIEQGEREKTRAQEPRTHAAGPLRWLAWLVPTGAAALAVSLFFQPNNPFPVAVAPNPPQPALTDHEVETPSEDVSSMTFYAAEDSMTVVWLGRLDFL